MTPTELSARVSAHFPDAKRIDESVVQFTRRAGSRPFAVYYVDCRADIPGTLDELRSYQDRVISRRYFDGPKSLQWNNYVYFVATDDRLHSSDALRIRGLLEQDRSYARKFLIGEGDLDLILEPDVVAPDQMTEVSVLSIWNNRLAQAGLGRAIWADLDMPKRLALIEAATSPRALSSQAPSATAIAPGRSLSRLSLKQYRTYPLDRDFEFGAVNLIFGPNASGKTSLMEAIELLYCGRNKRSPSARPKYDLYATFDDNSEERVDDARSIKQLRERNLSWYGQPEVLTNNLYSSFARFNFLDTDAAVRLAEEATKIDEELSKLLIGPDAARTWENMLKVLEQARLRLKNLRDEEKSLRRQITDADALIATLTGGASSNLVRHRLLNMLRQQNWRAQAVENSDDLAAQLIGPLSELVALARQAADLPLSPMPSRTTLDRFTRSLSGSREKVSADINALGRLERQINTTTTEIERAREATIILQRVIRLVTAGIPARIAERNQLRQSVATLLNQLTGIDRAAIGAAAAQYLGFDVGGNLARVSAARAEATEVLERTRAEYVQLQAMRERSANLAEELKGIAFQLLSETGNETECPLCHTIFGAGELIAHINSELTSQIGRREEQVAARLRQAEETDRNVMAEESIASGFVAFASRAGLSPDTTLVQIAAAVDKAENNLFQASRQLMAVEDGLTQLEEQGLRWTDAEPTRTELVKVRFPLRDWSKESSDLLAATIVAHIKDQDSILSDCVRNADKLRQQIATVLSENFGTAEQARVGLSGLEQRSASAESLATKLAALDGTFPIPKNKPLGELAVEAEAIRQVAIELQTAIQQERDNNVIRSQTAAKCAELSQEVDKIAPRIKSLSAAVSVLQRLQREHSLHSAMQEAIRQNRSAIESIFGQIHVPHEFSGLGEDITTLRRLDGTVGNLNEISTGQRSALGLSMFLAQNMKLRVAPPVILIDDPIAHVDDLNCLSFLDYLREIALTKRRQIFFSTANDKLAAMFERKFDFLGLPEFRKIVLHRESGPPYAP